MNTNLAIIGVVFATIWAGTAVRQGAVTASNESLSSHSEGVTSAIVFKSGREPTDTVEVVSSLDGSRETKLDSS